MRALWACPALGADFDPPAPSTPGAELGFAPLWLGRGPGFDLHWQIGDLPPPHWPENAIVLHLAGATGARALSQRVGGAQDHNAELIAPLLQACASNRVRHVFFASTAAVYAPSALAAREDEPALPTNDYGRSKLRAERLLQAGLGPIAQRQTGLTVVRMGNIAGADALLAPRALGDNDADEIRLDPVPGEPRGPIRSWIGPLTLARSLAQLINLVLQGHKLPEVLNLAVDPPFGMAELLNASGRPWRWAAPNPAVVPFAGLDVSRLKALIALPALTPDALIAEIALAQKALAHRPRSVGSPLP